MESELISFYLKNNFKLDKNLYYGIYRNRIVCVNESTTKIRVIINFNMQVLKEAGRNISIKCGEVKKKYRALLNAITTNVYQELIIYKENEIANSFNNILDDVLNILDLYSPSKIEVCPLCGQTLSTNEPFLRLGDNVIQAHNSCIEKFINQSKIKTEIAKNATSKTIVSSIIAMLFSSIVFVGLSFFDLYEHLAYLSGFLYVIVITFSLKHFKIIPNDKQKIIISIFAFLCVLLTTIFGAISAIYALNEISYFAILKNFGKVFLSNYKAILSNFGLNSLLTFLDLFFFFKSMPNIKNIARKIK